MDLTDLALRIKAAVAEAHAPPPPGGSKPVVWPTNLLGEDGWELLWKVAREVRRRAPETFARFPELTLVLRVADELGGDPELDFDALLVRLEAAADEYGPRVVSTSICNVVMHSSAIRLADDAMLIRGYADRNDPGDDDDASTNLKIKAWLGVPMPRPLRLVELAQPYDTTRTAALLTVEQGVPPLALARARARAQYAVAMWTVLAPPTSDGVRTVLPDLGLWVPQPLVHCPQQHRSLAGQDEGAPPPFMEGGGFNDYRMFDLPSEDDLRLPFAAMGHTDRRGAQAVLSASLHLLAAGRASRLLPSERARSLMAAIESLGEPPSPQGKPALKRFLRLVRRLGTDDVMASRGWGPADVAAGLTRIKNARNIASHGADAVLLDLGYPVDAMRETKFTVVAGTELAAGSIQSDLPALVHVVGRTLEATIRDLAADGWEDKAFLSYFA